MYKGIFILSQTSSLLLRPFLFSLFTQYKLPHNSCLPLGTLHKAFSVAKCHKAHSLVLPPADVDIGRTAKVNV